VVEMYWLCFAFLVCSLPSLRAFLVPHIASGSSSFPSPAKQQVAAVSRTAYSCLRERVALDDDDFFSGDGDDEDDIEQDDLNEEDDEYGYEEVELPVSTAQLKVVR
jgi:hypothetical protein